MSTLDIFKPHKKQILITCKTYPAPSKRYEELVCVAGVTSKGEWIRLAPIDFRRLSYERQFKKYSIIEAIVERHTGDPRSETYRPDPNSIRVINQVDTTNGWQERNNLILPLSSTSVEELIAENKNGDRSLGVIKVNSGPKLVVEEADPAWRPSQAQVLERQNLFEGKNRPLDKIPWKFKYSFKCNADSCRGHKMLILDWEIYALYRRLLRETGNIGSALAGVKHMYQEMFSLDKKNLHLFVGTSRTHLRSFMIVGVYYPPKSKG